ncbi:MAG: hypothetical protein H7301_09670 [Cryobacterium sp.]|nr:hypothetical protein [Oligoflexia bacterium]
MSSIGILRAWDNVDGLFGDLVTKTFQDHLAGRSRFTVQDLGKANQLLQGSKLSYAKMIEDPEILKAIAKNSRVDTFLRTKVYKEGSRYRMTIDWVHAAKMQLIGTESVEIEQPFRGEGKFGTEEFRQALTSALDRLIGKIPFKGSVTGRDQTSVTVNLGSSSGIGKGDTLIIGTLDEVKYHPLLKTIVDWRLTSTGKATVDEVDEGMAFAKIEGEEYGRQIQRFQKIIQIIPSPENTAVETRTLDREELEKKSKEPPRIGWIAPGILLGSTSRDTGKDSGSGFLYGMKAEGQAWFNSNLFGELKFAYGSAAYSQEDSLTHVKSLDGVNASLSQVRLALGTFYHVTPNFFGPKGWIKVGYQSTTYGLPQNATAQTGSLSHSGIYIGVGGDLPIRDDAGMLLDVDFGLFGSGTDDSGAFGTSSSANSVNVFAGGYLWLKPKMKLQLGLDFKSASLDFVSGKSVSNKTFALAPSLLFYF